MAVTLRKLCTSARQNCARVSSFHHISLSTTNHIRTSAVTCVEGVYHICGGVYHTCPDYLLSLSTTNHIRTPCKSATSKADRTGCKKGYGPEISATISPFLSRSLVTSPLSLSFSLSSDLVLSDSPNCSKRSHALDPSLRPG